jgi:CysZ protein
MSILHGGAYLFRGMRLITLPGIRLFALIPLVINISLFAGLSLYLLLQADGLVEAVLPTLPAWLQWLEWLAWLMFVIAAVVLSFFAVSLAANLIAAPFNELLAERVEQHLTGAGNTPADPGQWMRTIPAAVMGELHKLGYFAVRAVPLLLLYLVPGVNVLAPLLWLLFSAWMLALEYTDYPMGNHEIQFQSRRRLLSQQRFTALGFGGAVLGGTIIPLVNLFIMPAAVAGATALWVERLKANR